MKVIMNSKKLLTFILILFLAVGIFGCNTASPAGDGPKEAGGNPTETTPAETKDPEGNAENSEDLNVVKEDSGSYVGLIDNHSIEIEISGVPKEQAARAFELSDKVKEDFESIGLETGDQVHISYYKNEHGQLVLESIEKIDS